MDPKRQHWNEQQQLLKTALRKSADHAAALDLFLRQHAAVYPAQMDPGAGVSFEDEALDGLSEAALRAVPPNTDHSIAWMIWHATRCEDITFNLLVAGADQVLTSGGWLEKTRSTARDTGNTMDAEAARAFSAAVDVDALRAYRLAVGRRTREIVSSLPVGAFQNPADPARVGRILAEGAVLPEAVGLVEYWGGQTVAGLMLMPGTRHHLVHWNEALKLRPKAARAGAVSGFPSGGAS